MINLVLLTSNVYIPDIIPKYLFSKSGVITLPIYDDFITEYDESLYTDVSTIETNQGVGTPGILNTVLSYGRGSICLEETVNLDLTDSSTFLNDINGWLFMNNFFSISYDVGLDKYLVNDPSNKAYIHIKYI